MIATQTYLPEEAYQLATRYEMGEPIRVYRVAPMRFRTFGLMVVAFSGLLSGIGFVSSSFRINPIDYWLYGFFSGISLLACLPVFIGSRKMQNAAVYIYTTGFIYSTQ